MKRTIVLLLVIFPFISIAQQRNIWDCKNLDFIQAKQDIIAKILPEKTQSYNLKIVNIALVNLKKYCNYDWNVLQTPYFLNHLLDVYFRFLDWIKTNNYSEPLFPLSVTYRESLKSIAENNFRWIDPNKIDELYKYFIWEISPLYFEFCSKYGSLQNFAEKKDSIPNFITTVWKYTDTCNNISYNRVNKEILLLTSMKYKVYYSNYQQKLFEKYKEYASKFDNLYNIFTVALWDFYYLVNRFIKVTDASTK